MAGFTLKAARRMCLRGVIPAKTYFEFKRYKKATQQPLHTRKKFDITKYSDRESLLLFRFTPSQILRIAKVMGIPETVRLANRIKLKGIEAFAILLRRLCYPNRLYDLVHVFGRDVSSLSRISTWMTNWIYSKYARKISTFKQRWLSKHHMEQFAEACSSVGSVYSNIIGFIDGTGRPICRPTDRQEEYYSGYYKEHLIKYQGVILPNGIMTRLDGPFKGRRHDSAIIHLSKIIPEMQKLFINEDGTWYSLYGDAGYANQKFVKVGFKNFKKLTDLQKKFNADMSSLRTSVEYGFGKVIQLFAFLDFKKNQKLLMQPLKQQYYVAAILTNIHTCLNGSQVADYFSCDPPTLEEYLS